MSQAYFYLFRYTNDFYFPNTYEFSIPILKMRKPKHKGFKELVQNYTAGSGKTDSIISRQISEFLCTIGQRPSGCVPEEWRRQEAAP